MRKKETERERKRERDTKYLKDRFIKNRRKNINKFAINIQ